MKQKIPRQQYNDSGIQGQDIFNFIALSYKELNINEAIRVFRLGLFYYPQDYNIISNLAGIYLENNDTVSALPLLQSAKKIENDMVELDVSDENNQIKSGFDLIQYENFSQDKVAEVSKVLIEELQKYYKVAVDNSHIFYFLGNIYYTLKLNFFALICFMREIKLNEDDKSKFASFSKSYISNRIIDNLTDFEKHNIVLVSTDNIIENLDKFKKQLQFEQFEDKKIFFLQVIFAFHQLICEYLYCNYSIKLDEERPFSLISLSSHDLFKIGDYPKIFEVLELDNIAELYDKVTKQNISDVFLFYEKFIDYNIPLIVFPNIEKLDGEV